MKLKELPISLFHSIRLRYGKKKTSNKQIPVVVSLTTIPDRLNALDIVISSLLEQRAQPKLIVLWLNESLRARIPEKLEQLQGEVFKIKFCEGTSSFRKLLPSLQCFQDSVIVTCDDDMIYPNNWLEGLYQSHLKHDGCVVSQVGRLVQRGGNGKVLPYKQWPFIRSEYSDNNFLPIGYGGVLYPIGTFGSEVFNEAVYLKLCPKADDLWFKAMAYLNGKSAYCASEQARPIPLIGSQKISLNKENIANDRNREQWEQLCDHFPELYSLQ